jgi:hypothetical protein
LDQRSGEATCWARLSYYSGLAPGDGLKFPKDLAIYPIIPGWNETSTNATIGEDRELLWEPLQARLTRGWLRSRTPTQYLTVRARKSPHQIQFASWQGRLRATNKLGTEIAYLVAVDGDGNLFAGQNVPLDARTELQPTVRTEAIRTVRQLIMDNDPQSPAALADGDADYIMMERRQSQMVRRRYGGQYGDAQFPGNLLNEAIANLGGLDGLPALQLPPRSYVAFTETGPEVEIGMRGAEEQASFHVVVGEW